MNTDLTGGYGFACFLYILGFLIALSAAVYLSPLAGSKLEAKILSTPQEFDQISGITPDNTVNAPFARAEPLYSGYPDPQAGASKI